MKKVIGLVFLTLAAVASAVVFMSYNFAEGKEEMPEPEINTFLDSELNNFISYKKIVYEPNGFFDEFKEKISPTPVQYELQVNESGLKRELKKRNEEIPLENWTTSDWNDEYILVTVTKQYDTDAIIKAAHTETEIDIEDYLLNDPKITDSVSEIYKKWHIQYPETGDDFYIPEEYIENTGDCLKINLEYARFVMATLAESDFIPYREEVDFDGKHLVFDGLGTVKRELNVEEEYAFVKTALMNGDIENVREHLSLIESPRNDEYKIFVDIDAQHLWVVDGSNIENIIMESDIVTGDVSKGRGTPLGLYYVMEAIDGKYLTGPGYTTWVNKWMRLTYSGVGLHDAGWRGKFGGKIYTYDGSHGCINLPKQFAYDLFDIVSVGTRVYVYNSLMVKTD